MSVVLVCPACGHPHTLHRGSVPEVCDRCAAPFPEAARATARTALAADAAPRPLLLTIGMGLAAFWAAVATLVVLIAVLGNGPYSVNGRPVTKAEFLVDMWPFIVLIPLAAGVAWALWRERAPVRHFLFGCLVATAGLTFLMPGMETGARIAGAVWGMVYLAGGAWYLYRKANVVAYFARLEAPDAPPPRPAGV